MLLKLVMVITLLITSLQSTSLSPTTNTPTTTNIETQSKANILLTSLRNLQDAATGELAHIKNTTQAATTQERYLAAKAAHDECINLAQQGLNDLAVTKGLEAMTLYRATLENAVSTDPDPIAETSGRAIELKTLANRLIKYLLETEAKITQAKKLGYNTTRIETSIAETRQNIKEAYTTINILDVNKADALLAEVKIKLEKLNNQVTNLTKQIQLTRANQYVIAAKQRVSTLRTTIFTNTPSLTANAYNASTNALNQAQTSLTAAETYYNKGMVNETLQNLTTFSAKEQQTIQILKSSGVTVNSIDTP